MKNQFILLLLLVNLASCDVFRPASRRTDNLSSDGTKASKENAEPGFIQNISTDSAEVNPKRSESPLYRNVSAKTTIPNLGTESYDPLQFKYAILTNAPVEELNNPRLLLFMDHWYGVPYHYGGNQQGWDRLFCFYLPIDFRSI